MKLRNLKIGQRLGGGFGVIIVLMIAITGIGSYQLFESNLRIGAIANERIPATVLVNTIKSDLTDMVGNMCNILIDSAVGGGGDKADGARDKIAVIEQDMQFVEENSAKLEIMLAGSSEGMQQIKDLKETRATFNEARDRFLALVKDGQLEQARALFLSEIRAFAESYARVVDSLVAYEGKLAVDAGKDADVATRMALLFMAGLATVASLVGIVVAVRVTRGIVKPLTAAVAVAECVAGGDLTMAIKVDSTDEIGKLLLSLKNMNESLARIVGEVRHGTDTIAVASVEIATGNLDLSSRTEQQTNSLEEATSSMEQLTRTVKQNADNAHQANQLALSASTIAVQGRSVVSQVVDTMDAINMSSKKIVDIIGVIDSIAFQTNILALNAAVEAARAGEQGRGFAVVASEVRNLAQRAASAAKEIKALIVDSVGKVDTGAKLVDQAGATMNQIVDSVKRVTDIMADITTASREQSSGIEQINETIMQMDEATQQNAALVEEATAAAQSLQAQAGRLLQTVGVFRIPESDAAVAGPEDAHGAAPAGCLTGNPIDIPSGDEDGFCREIGTATIGAARYVQIA